MNRQRTTNIPAARSVYLASRVRGQTVVGSTKDGNFGVYDNNGVGYLANELSEACPEGFRVAEHVDMTPNTYQQLAKFTKTGKNLLTGEDMSCAGSGAWLAPCHEVRCVYLTGDINQRVKYGNDLGYMPVVKVPPRLERDAEGNYVVTKDANGKDQYSESLADFCLTTQFPVICVKKSFVPPILKPATEKNYPTPKFP